MNTIAGSNVWASSSWIYFVGPFTASMIAAAVFKVIFAPENDDDDVDEDTKTKHKEEKPEALEAALPDIVNDVEMNRFAQRVHERLRK